MNMVYVAYSCSPYSGSENAIGWNVSWISAASNNVYVVTKLSHRKSIEKYLSQNDKRNISFYYVDIPEVAKFLKDLHIPYD